MINKLKRKFLVIGTVLMFVLMTALVLIMNLVNYRGVVSDADAVLDMLSQPNLPFIDDKEHFDDKEHPEDKDPRGEPDSFSKFVPRGMSPEVPYESRYFTVIVSSDGKIVRSDLSRIISVDENSAEEYIDKALKSGASRGFVGSFRFSETTDENGTRIIFLDCGRKLESFMSFLWISVIVGLGGCVAVFIVFIFTAGKIVSPIAESYEKQKRFISDAGHEIKTPLTIINANVDLLESDGEKEELSDIRQQTERLTELTNNLILLSKMEESEHTLQKIEFPLSDLVGETVGSFRAPAASRGLELIVDVMPNVTACGSPDAIRRLVSVLMENAVKYSVDGGKVTVALETRRKSASFTVSNETDSEINENDLPHVFDRFYRTDVSRNSGTGGHGIGLSIAKAIVDAHGGTITAHTSSGHDFSVTAVLPL